MIKYLDESGKALCRPLWEEAFPDDTEGFLDGYFGRKVKDSRVLAAVDESDGRVLSMIHRNPTHWPWGDCAGTWTTWWPAPPQRTCGDRDTTGELVKRLFADLTGEGAPVTFLMPAIRGGTGRSDCLCFRAPRGCGTAI